MASEQQTVTENLKPEEMLSTSCEDSARVSVKTTTIGIQANSYDLERSGRLPARQRFLPSKFRDYEPLDETLIKKEEEDDEDYTPQKPESLAPNYLFAGKRKRGRARNPGNSSDSRQENHMFQCQQCSKSFKLKGNLQAHMIVHTDHRPFACNVDNCSKTFRSKENLRRHNLSEHLKVKNFPCKECEKQFVNAHTLREHMALHTGELLYQCPHCEKPFRQRSGYQRHLAVHSNEKKFKCKVCGMDFKHSAYLKSHMRRHTGEKPYGCEICQKKFAYHSDLLRHRIIHTGAKPYGCKTCGAKFNDNSSRRRHELEHEKDKPFPCQFCSDSFKRAGQLKCHLGKKHMDRVVNDEVQVIREGPRNALKFVFKDQGNEKVTKYMAPVEGSDPSQIAAVIQQLIESEGNQENNTIYLAAEPQDVQVLVQQLQDQLGNRAGVTMQQEEVVTEEAEQLYQESDFSEQPMNEVFTENLQYQVLKDENVVEIQYAGHINKGEEQNISENIASVEQNVGNSPYVRILELQEDNNPSSGKDNPNELQDEDISSVNEINIEQSSQAGSSSDQHGESDGLVTPAKQPSPDQHTEQSLEDYLNQSEHFIESPDFSSQEYYNWLSRFTDVCRNGTMPLEKVWFQKINHVHKSISEVLFSPTGILTDKNNYCVLRTIAKQLSNILEDHLNFVQASLGEGETVV